MGNYGWRWQLGCACCEGEADLFVGRFDSNNLGSFFGRLKSDGTEVWNYGTGIFNQSVACDPNGNSVFGHERTTGNLTLHVFDREGNLQWTFDHGGHVRGVAIDSAGAVYLGGVVSSGVSLRKLDSSGAPVWTFNHGDTIQSVAVHDTSGDVYIGGLRNATTNTTKKLNSSGSEQWAVNHGANILGVAVDEDGNVCAVGNPANGDPAEPSARLYDSAGSEIWTYVHGDALQGAAFDASGDVYVCGQPSGGDTLFKLSGVDGSVIWSALPSTSTTRAVAVDHETGRVYSTNLLGGLFCHDGSDGSQVWNASLGLAVGVDCMPGRIGAFPPSP